MGEFLENVATQYAAEQGWVVIPARPGEKTPAGKWGAIQDTKTAIEHCAKAGNKANACLYLGEVSNDTVDIDIDDLKALRLGAYWLPDNTMIFGRASKLRSHYLFKSPDAITKRFSGFKADCSNHSGVIIELRANAKNQRKAKGAYTVIPPSIHTSGESIEWANDAMEPVAVPASILMQVCTRIQICVQLAQLWEEGGRHDLSLLVAGTLSKARVLRDEANSIIEGICLIAGDEDIEGRLTNVETTYDTLESGQNVMTLRSYEHDNKQWEGIDQWVHKACKSTIRGSGKERVVYFPEDISEVIQLMTRASLKHQLNWYELEGVGPVMVVGGRVERLTEGIIYGCITTFVDWQSINAKGENVTKAPSRTAVNAYLTSVPEMRKLPELRGIVNNPIFNDDWQLVTQDGYDEKTKIYIHRGPAPFLDLETDDAGVDSAVDNFYELFGEFPFVDRDSAVATCLLATMMTALKCTLGPTPMTLFTAPTNGAGKTFAAEVIAELGSGSPATLIAMSSQREELDKALAAQLVKSSSTLVIDNISRQLKSDLLTQALSQPLTEVRILGTSDIKEIRSNTSIFATGVNGQINADIARRTLVVNLDPRVERGKTLNYDRDPLNEIREYRDEYLADMFSIVQAYTDSEDFGQSTLEKVANYGGKIQVLREAIVWAGLPDPFDLLGVNLGTNQELEGVKTLFAAIDACFGNEPFTPQRFEADTMTDLITDENSPFSELNFVLRSMGVKRANSALDIGRLLTQFENSISGGFQLTKKRTKKGMVYRLLSIGKG